MGNKLGQPGEYTDSLNGSPSSKKDHVLRLAENELSGHSVSQGVIFNRNFSLIVYKDTLTVLLVSPNDLSELFFDLKTLW